MWCCVVCACVFGACVSVPCLKSVLLVIGCVMLYGVRVCELFNVCVCLVCLCGLFVVRYVMSNASLCYDVCDCGCIGFD